MIDRLMTSGTAQQANIDMYPIEFYGFELPIPNPEPRSYVPHEDELSNEEKKETKSAVNL